MQRTNIFIASSSEMRHERLELVDLFTEMCSDTIRYVPVKWEYMDSAVHQEHKQSEYMLRLRKSEICIVMFWRSLGEYTEKELRLALEEQSKGNNPQRTYVLFKEDGEPVKPELKELREKLVQRHGDIVFYFSNNYELRELTKGLVYSANVKCKEDNWNGKEVKVMIAADEELDEEKLEFTELIAHLNEVLESRGIRIHREKWTPHGADDFREKLLECGMCLNLYWTRMPQLADEEMKIAYNLSTKGTSPLHLFIFFKEPSEEISAALVNFKTCFETDYGHFFCKYENVDTMNLQFILQFEAYQNNMHDDIIKVSDGKVVVGDKDLVNLDNVPFASLNKEYQRMQHEILEIKDKLAEARAKYRNEPDNESLEDELMTLRSKYKKKGEEIEMYQQHLYDIAKIFAKASGERYTERMKKARELFEKGNVIEADEILNMEEMKREKEYELRQYEQNRHNLEMKIEEFCLKVKTIGANTLLSYADTFVQTCEAYEEAIDTAKRIHYDEKKLADILSMYALNIRFFTVYGKVIETFPEINNENVCLSQSDVANEQDSLIQRQYRQKEAVEAYEEALRIYQGLAKQAPEEYSLIYILTQNELGDLLCVFKRDDEAEKCYTESLNTLKQLTCALPETNMMLEMARTFTRKARLQHNLNQDKEAESNYHEALRIYHEVGDNRYEVCPMVPITLDELAELQQDLNRYEEAAMNYKESLKLFRNLAKEDPNGYLKWVVETLRKIAKIHIKQSNQEEAVRQLLEALKVFQVMVEKNINDDWIYELLIHDDLNDILCNLPQQEDVEKAYKEAVMIYKKTAKLNVDYWPCVSSMLNKLANSQCHLGRFKDAEKNYNEAIEIYRHHVLDDYELNDAKVSFIRELGGLLYNLANLQREQKREEESERNYNKALEIQQELADEFQGEFLLDLAGTLNNLAILQHERRQYEESEKNYRKALDSYMKIQDKIQEEHVADVAAIQNNLAFLLYELNRCEESKKFFKKALNIYESLEMQNPGMYVEIINDIKECLD